MLSPSVVMMPSPSGRRLGLRWQRNRSSLAAELWWEMAINAELLSLFFLFLSSLTTAVFHSSVSTSHVLSVLHSLL